MTLKFDLAVANPEFQVTPPRVGDAHNPAATLMDENGNVQGNVGNPLWVNATLIATSNLSVGPNGLPIPLDSTQIGGEDAAGNLQQSQFRSAAPAAGLPGLVVRNIPSGTQAVSAPGGAALALDATLTNGTQLAQVTGTGTAGAPVAGVVSVQGVPGGTPVPVSGTVSAGSLTNNNLPPGANNQGVLPAVANAAAPVWVEGNQVLLSTDLAGAMRVTGTVTANNASVGATGAAVPASATQIGGTDGTNLRAPHVYDTDSGAGTEYTLGATLRASAPGGSVETGTSANPLRVDPTGTTSQPVTQATAANLKTQAVGTLTHNNAAPAATNLGALVGLANAATPTFTEGDQVLLSTDLAGNLRVTPSGTSTVAGSLTNNNAAPAANNLGVLPAVANAAAPTWTEGRQVLASVDLSGGMRVSQGTAANLNATVVQGTAANLKTQAVGTLTHNNAAPAATNVGVLPALANAAAPTFTEGDQVLASVDLAGNLRASVVQATAANLKAQVVGTLTHNNAAPAATNIGVLDGLANAATPTFTEGDQVLASRDLSGAQRVTGGQTPTATLTNVASSAASVSLLASNTSRKGVLLTNDSNKNLMLKYGATASATSFSVLIPPSAYWEMPWPIYTGAIDGIWSAANGSARITEL